MFGVGWPEAFRCLGEGPTGVQVLAFELDLDIQVVGARLPLSAIKDAFIQVRRAQF